MTLAEYMRLHGFSPEQMAERVGNCSASGLKKWMYGSRIPNGRTMARFAEVTNGEVMPNDWVTATPTSKARRNSYALHERIASSLRGRSDLSARQRLVHLSQTLTEEECAAVIAQLRTSVRTQASAA